MPVWSSSRDRIGSMTLSSGAANSSSISSQEDTAIWPRMAQRGGMSCAAAGRAAQVRQAANVSAKRCLMCGAAGPHGAGPQPRPPLRPAATGWREGAQEPASRDRPRAAVGAIAVIASRPHSGRAAKDADGPPEIVTRRRVTCGELVCQFYGCCVGKSDAAEQERRCEICEWLHMNRLKHD